MIKEFKAPTAASSTPGACNRAAVMALRLREMLSIHDPMRVPRPEFTRARCK